MAAAFGVMGSISDCRSGSASSIRLRNFGKKKGGNRKNGFTVFCVSSSSLTDPYKTLKIRHEASESETIYRLIETGDGAGEDRHEILLAIKVFKPADVSLGLSLYGVEASGALRCGLNNGGCWKQTHDGHTYSACIDDKTKGCKCPPGFKGDGINSCEDNGHPCRNSRTP